jgi:hypothetical protein
MEFQIIPLGPLHLAVIAVSDVIRVLPTP